MNGFIKFLASVHGDTRREPQFLKIYTNHTILTPPQRAEHLVMFKISIHLCRSKREKNKKQKQNNNKQPHASTEENITDVFSKSSNSQDHLS